jgi:hypothetical protein
VFAVLPLFFFGCKECEECNNLYHEPKARVIFLDTLNGAKLDSIRIKIHSFNGRTDLFQRDDSIARFFFPIRMDSDTTSYSINYTAYLYKQDTLVGKISDKRDSIVTTLKKEELSKEFSIQYTLKKAFYNDRYLWSAIMETVHGGENNIILSCSSCSNDEATIYIYEAKKK